MLLLGGYLYCCAMGLTLAACILSLLSCHSLFVLCPYFQSDGWLLAPLSGCLVSAPGMIHFTDTGSTPRSPVHNVWLSVPALISTIHKYETQADWDNKAKGLKEGGTPSSLNIMPNLSDHLSDSFLAPTAAQKVTLSVLSVCV